LCVKTIPRNTATVIEQGRAADTPAALVQEGSTDAQRVVRGTLGSIADDARTAGIRPPAVVVIGDVVTALA
jgi:uroporphyrin-III C-methyltransferase/precorrin-2 dehydrogenase/sirohydrochlorin ferrochelatase